MKPGSVAVVGAAETELGALPHMSEGDLHIDAALRALDDAGLTLGDVDGVTSAVHSPVDIAHQLGIRPNWFDGTSVGGCSFLVHVAHAAEAIAAGHAQTVLVLHGESRRSAVGRAPRGHTADSIFGQFEAPFGVYGPPTLFTLPSCATCTRRERPPNTSQLCLPGRANGHTGIRARAGTRDSPCRTCWTPE